MAAGGEGYFHASYWHDSYWHNEYWLEASPIVTAVARGGFNPQIYDMLEHIPVVIYLLWMFT